MFKPIFLILCLAYALPENLANIVDDELRFERSVTLTIKSTKVVAIESAAFRERFLRLDCSAPMPLSGMTGAGTVNLQRGVSNFERIRLTEYTDGSVSMEAVAHAGRFLRADCSNGLINCQHSIAEFELFSLEDNEQDGTVSFRSHSNGKLLSANGENVHELSETGGGHVSCQTWKGPWEKFFIHDLSTNPAVPQHAHQHQP